MKIGVASGKGGVGKSMLASSLALLYAKDTKVVACDCDVDAPNLGLWLGVTEYDSKETISVSEKAQIVNQEACDENIVEICQFHAIETKEGEYFINPFLCEGCGTCNVAYPEAVEIHPVKNAEIRTKQTEHGFPLVSGQLYPGESGSGKIVDELRKKADVYPYDMMILDVPAGVGCPVIASVRGIDFAVLVTEPTPSGFSDLKRILETVSHFDVPYGVVVNKWNINREMFKEIRAWSGNQYLGRISFDKKVIDSIVNLRPVIQSNSDVVEEINNIFRIVRDVVQGL